MTLTGHHIDLWTLQLAQWRRASALGIELIDITTKSGDARFAPGWDIIQLVKRVPELTQAGIDTYTKLYRERMLASYRNYESRWLEILAKDAVALACYCPPNTFCHRHLLVDYFKKVGEHHGVVINMRGELLPEAKG